jgi:hypothetical protein
MAQWRNGCNGRGATSERNGITSLNMLQTPRDQDQQMGRAELVPEATWLAPKPIVFKPRNAKRAGNYEDAQARTRTWFRRKNGMRGASNNF